MGSLSNTMENSLLDHIFSKVTYTASTNQWIALFTATPSDTGGGTEVTGGSYARVQVTNNATTWPAAASGSKSNGITVTFPAPTANWGTVTSFGVMAAATGTASADFVGWGSLAANKTINSGDGAPSFAALSLVITLD